jgi:hypothetical protein
MVDRFNVVVHLVDPFFPPYSPGEDEESGYKTGMEREGCYFPHDFYFMWNRYFLHHHFWEVVMPQLCQSLEYIGAGNSSGGG